MKRKVPVAAAERVEQLSSPFLAELDGLKRSLIRKGREVSDLGRYAMSLDPPESHIDTARFTAADLKNCFSEHLLKTYNIRVNPDREMMLLPGGRATLLVLGAYLVEQDRICFVPDPGFSAYRHMVLLFRGQVRKYQLLQRNDYLPNIKQFEGATARSLKLLLINSPHNPTGAVCDAGCYAKLEQLATRENILVIADSSYCLSAVGNLRAPPFLSMRKRFKVGLEFFSLSTSLCAPELKLTVLVGRRELLAPIGRLVNSFGMVPCPAVAQAAARYFASPAALAEHIARCREEIKTRTRLVVDILDHAGIEHYPVVTLPYVWVKLKRGRASLYFCRSLLRRRGISIAPGSAFGEEGEGWIRIAVNLPGAELTQAVQEIVKHFQPIKSRLRERKKS